MTTTVLAISSIEVPGNRQRKTFPEQEMEELKSSILTEKGLMCPILVRPGRDPDHYFLVAGERRFRAISTIDCEYTFGNDRIKPGNIPVVLRNFSSEMEATEAELHENIIRLNLSWQEKAEAIAALHKLRSVVNPRQTLGQTASELDDSPTTQKTGYATSTALKNVQHAILVSEHLNDPEVAKAASLKDATKIVTRKLEEEMMERLYNHRQIAQLKAAQQKAEEAANPSPPGLADMLASLSSPSVVSNLLDTSFTLLAGDMREKIKEVADGSVNVIITDPPYGENVANFNEGAAPQPHRYSEENFRELHDTLTTEMGRLCAASAHVYIFCNVAYFTELRTGIEAKGWRVRPTPLIWYKKRGALSDGLPVGYRRSYELILFAQRGGRPCSVTADDVITVSSVAKKLHAAQKPVELYQRLLDMSAVPGDTVLDAFAGSGTIFHAVRKRAFKAIGIENDPLYIEVCNQAIEGIVPEMEPEL